MPMLMRVVKQSLTLAKHKKRITSKMLSGKTPATKKVETIEMVF